MLDSSCHPPLPPAGGLPVCTGPDFKKKRKKDRGKSAGQASTRGRSFRHSRRFSERHSGANIKRRSWLAKTPLASTPSSREMFSSRRRFSFRVFLFSILFHAARRR